MGFERGLQDDGHQEDRQETAGAAARAPDVLRRDVHAPEG